MEWFELEKATFFGVVWLLAFLVSLCRSLSERHPKSLRVSVGSSGVAGFLAFAIVCVFCGRGTASVADHFYYLGLATVIGMMGKYQERMLALIAKKYGLSEDESKKNEIPDR